MERYRYLNSLQNFDDAPSYASSPQDSTSPREGQDREDNVNKRPADGLNESNFYPPPYPLIPPQDKIRRLPRNPTEHDSSADGNNERTLNHEINRRISQRAQLVPSRYGPPGIAPGRPVSAEEHTFYKCEDEPIHIPGAIQQYGALVALKYNDQGDLVPRIASENTFKILKIFPRAIVHFGFFS
ncbi:hypothetical protein DID88_003760 [Monilinia fructigena]|uniref:PAS fold-2 domain-containing protein n=1 Tax=Monilinia fructigena TaxID=38457 RepID=A0A395ISR1_9HELO|nr:hypothetical protein DID88_003760 [Monilinia fructigena]